MPALHPYAGHREDGYEPPPEAALSDDAIRLHRAEASYAGIWVTTFD